MVITLYYLHFLFIKQIYPRRPVLEQFSSTFPLVKSKQYLIFICGHLFHPQIWTQRRSQMMPTVTPPSRRREPSSARRPWGPAGPKSSEEEGTAALGLSDTGQLAPSAFSDSMSTVCQTVGPLLVGRQGRGRIVRKMANCCIGRKGYWAFLRCMKQLKTHEVSGEPFSVAAKAPWPR